MLRSIHLHGSLAEKFQAEYRLDVETPSEALRALIIQVPGFEKELRGGEFVCVRGDFNSGIECDETLLQLHLGKVKDFHIAPAAVGAGRGGGKILLGIALIGATLFSGGAALGVFFGGAAGLGAGLGTVGLLGVGLGGLLVISGVAQAISSTPKNTQAPVDDRANYLFNGAFNSNQQGAATPLVFGRIFAGSVVVSAGVVAERTSQAVGTFALPGSTGTIPFVMEP